MNYLKTFLPYLFGNKKGRSLDVPLPSPIPWRDLSFEETLMFHTLINSQNAFVEELDLQKLSKKDIFHLFNFLPYLKHDLKNKIISHFKEELSFFERSLKATDLSIKELQELLDFKNGALSLFAILNPDRKRPGLLIIRDAEGKFLEGKDKIWSIPVLGLSSRGLPFHHSNGSTPQGVYSIDSVMPEANNPYEFGRFRRLILNFLDEDRLFGALPPGHRFLNWYAPSQLAGELGRSHLRIHGTGRTNFNPLTPYFPLVPTSGCLATNEARLLFNRSSDQRLLLDKLMDAQDLSVNFENESKIHGLLYVVEFSDSLSTLKFR